MSVLQATTAQARRALRVSTRPLSRRIVARRTRATSDAIRAATPAPAALGGPLAERVAVLTSYRLADHDRVAMLEVVAEDLARRLAGTDVPIHVDDASEGECLARSTEIWAATGLRVDHHRSPQPMAVALERRLAALHEPWFTLQFDDMLTAGITPDYLDGATQLLATWAGKVDVVAPIWPLDVRVEPGAGTVEVTSHRVHDDGTITFAMGARRRPLRIETFAGLRFGIFENFNYGFFFNSLVAPVADFRARLAWYRERLGTTSVHQIEMAAASGLRGPSWRHIAICLDGISILDVDYAHTTAAVRSEVPTNRAAFDGLRAGRSIVVRAQVDGGARGTR